MIKLFRKIRQQLVMENKTGKYFKYALGEIILVVIGILIALQINNWNENRKEANQEQLYLNRLLVENKEDIITFNTEISNLMKGVKTITTFSTALKKTDYSDSLLMQSANDYFQYGSLYPNFSSSTSTFDDLSSTGNLKILQSSNLRDQLVKHYAKHLQIKERIRVGTEWALPVDGAFTYEHSIMRFEPNSAFLFPEIPIQELANDLRTNKIDYINMIATHYWLKIDSIEQLEILINDTKSIISLIENNLR